MYATSSSDGVYHLLAPDQSKTLCGLEVAPIVIERPTDSSALYLISQADPNRQLCGDCSRIDEEAGPSRVNARIDR